MTALPRLTGLGPVARSTLPSPSPQFALDAGGIEIDRRVRREHMRVTIPFSGPSPWRAQDEINVRLRASLCDSGSLERLRAVHLEVQESSVVLSAAGAAHAVEHWLGGTRLTDAIAAAIVGASRDH